MVRAKPDLGDLCVRGERDLGGPRGFPVQSHFQVRSGARVLKRHHLRHLHAVYIKLPRPARDQVALDPEVLIRSVVHAEEELVSVRALQDHGKLRSAEMTHRELDFRAGNRCGRLAVKRSDPICRRRQQLVFDTPVSQTVARVDARSEGRVEGRSLAAGKNARERAPVDGGAVDLPLQFPGPALGRRAQRIRSELERAVRELVAALSTSHNRQQLLSETESLEGKPRFATL